MTRLRWLPWTSSASAAEPAMVEADPADLGTDLGLEARLGLAVCRPARPPVADRPRRALTSVQVRLISHFSTNRSNIDLAVQPVRTTA